MIQAAVPDAPGDQAKDQSRPSFPASSETRTSSGSTILNSALVAVPFFLVVTIAFTWPLAIQMHNTLPDGLDSTDTARQLGDIARNLLHNPLRLYDSPGLYPLNDDLALNELLIAQGIIAAPVIWLTGNMLLAWNLLTFSSFLLSGIAAWLLVRHATGSGLAGMAAGVIFAFSPWHYGQFGHLGIIAQHWMVFALYFLVLFMERSGGSRRLMESGNLTLLGLFALFTLVQSLSAGYYGYYGVMLFALYIVYYALRNAGIAGWLRERLRRVPPEDQVPGVGDRGSGIGWRRLAGQIALLGGAAVVVFAIMFPFIRPYNHAKSVYGFTRALQEVEYWSAGLKSVFRTTPTSWLYEPVQKGVFGLETSVEREMYPGVIAIALSIVGLATARRPARKRSLGPGFFALLVIVGFILSLGPTLHLDSYGIGSTGIPLPYRWLYENVPGFDALRVPHRFDLFVMLGLGGCAGFGIANLMSRQWGPPSVKSGWSTIAVGMVALGLVMVEFFAPGLRYMHRGIGADAPPLYRWLADPQTEAVIPKGALLLELPVGIDETPVNSSPQYLLYNLAHERPMLNGSPNIIPAGYERLFYEMRRFPTPGTLDIIEGLGVEYLIVHTAGLLNDNKRTLLEQEAQPGGRLEQIMTFPDSDGKAGYKDVVYRIKRDPVRFEKLRAAIPKGSSVLLADHPAHLRLTNTVLPRLIGPNRRYFATYRTIYDQITGEMERAEPGKVYDFAVIYKGSDPTQFGYDAKNRVDIGENDLIEVYRRGSD